MVGSLPEEQIYCRGTWGAIAYARDARGRMLAKEFLESVELRDKEVARLHHVFSVLAEFGPERHSNREQFRHEEGDIYAFKGFQARVGVFRDGRVLFLTHGFVKKRDRWPPAELERAKRIMREHQGR